jgi:hypothetical protein
MNISFSFEQLDISVESSRSTERWLVSQVGIEMSELDASGRPGLGGAGGGVVGAPRHDSAARAASPSTFIMAR